MHRGTEPRRETWGREIYGLGTTDPYIGDIQEVIIGVFIILLTLPAVTFCGLKKRERDVLVNIIPFHCEIWTLKSLVSKLSLK